MAGAVREVRTPLKTPQPHLETTRPLRRLVGFVKHGLNGKLLDQVARWGPDGWDTTRWNPRPPRVPKWLLQKVEGHMRRRIDG